MTVTTNLTTAELVQYCAASHDAFVREAGERLRAEVERLRALLRDVRSQPYGCPFCDSGKLRARVDGRPAFHAEHCVYASIDAALEEGGK